MQFKEMIVRVPSNDVASSRVVLSMIWTTVETNKSPGDIFLSLDVAVIDDLEFREGECVKR